MAGGDIVSVRMPTPRLSWPNLVLRWVVGMALVSWRYLWSTTPLHRHEEHDDVVHQPPSLPDDVRREDLQPAGTGFGSMFHRRFRVRIIDAELDAVELMRRVTNDFERFMPREVVRVHRDEGGPRRLRVNEDLVVDMPGPWDGPVRVSVAEPTRLRLATLQGHLEAGQIEFRATDDVDGLVFEIEAWAQSSGPTVYLLYARLGLAKEIQLNMWVRFCCAAAKIAGGRPRDGVEIATVVSPSCSTAPD